MGAFRGGQARTGLVSPDFKISSEFQYTQEKGTGDVETLGTIAALTQKPG